jgi:hypothetical protein
MIQILSIRTGALLITSIRIACILLFLVCLSIGTIRIVRLEAQIQERQRQIKDGNDSNNVNTFEQGDYFCGTSLLPCTQVKDSKITLQFTITKMNTYIS